MEFGRLRCICRAAAGGQRMSLSPATISAGAVTRRSSPVRSNPSLLDASMPRLASTDIDVAAKCSWCFSIRAGSAQRIGSSLFCCAAISSSVFGGPAWYAFITSGNQGSSFRRIARAIIDGSAGRMTAMVARRISPRTRLGYLHA